MHYLLLCLLLSLFSWGQHAEQPAKESHEDLRTATVLFLVEDVRNDRAYMLERSPGLDHFLRRRDPDGDEIIKKTDTRDARNLDKEFAGRFLRMQYEFTLVPGDCDLLYRLNMKGEKQEICAKDDKKAQEIRPFIEVLKKRF
jgi:hypothetical protein